MSLVYVKDLVQALLDLPGRGNRSETFHLSDGCSHTWRGIGAIIAEKLQRRPLRVPVPMPAIRLQCVVNGVLDRFRARASFVNPDKWNEISAVGWLCDSSRVRREFDLPPPTDLARGIELTLAWYRRNRWL
jgi:nucleoside-diphosphate-sugar epimerase